MHIFIQALTLCWSSESLSALLKGMVTVAGEVMESGFHSFVRQLSSENHTTFTSGQPLAPIYI